MTPDEAAEYQRLYAEFVAATAKAFAILRAKGIDSYAFLEADAEAGKLSVRLRELRGDAGKHWISI